MIRTGVDFRMEPKTHRGQRTSEQIFARTTLGARSRGRRSSASEPIGTQLADLSVLGDEPSSRRGRRRRSSAYVGAAIRTPRRRSPNVPAGKSTLRSPSTKLASHLTVCSSEPSKHVERFDTTSPVLASNEGAQIAARLGRARPVGGRGTRARPSCRGCAFLLRKASLAPRALWRPPSLAVEPPTPRASRRSPARRSFSA